MRRLLLLALLLLSVAQPALAQPASPNARGQRMQQALSELDLSAQQKQQLQTLLAEHRARMQRASPEERQAGRRQLMQKIGAILTPEQRAALKSKMGDTGRPQRTPQPTPGETDNG